MKTIPPRKYHGFLDIPEARVCTSGNHAVEVRHLNYEAGHSFPLISGRTALLANHSAKRVAWNTPTRFHDLCEDNARWTTDLPIEQFQHNLNLRPIRGGSVLVGGLGLGLAVTLIARVRSVKRIVAVELSSGIVQLVSPFLKVPKNVAVEYVTTDLFDFLKNTNEQFDWAFYDIWRSDGEGTFFETVVPLHEASHGKVKHTPLCWNEDVMRGQLLHSLNGRLAFRGNKEVCDLDLLAEYGKDIWRNWSVPFFRWVRDKDPSPDALHIASLTYAHWYGIPGWEDQWRRFCE